MNLFDSYRKQVENCISANGDAICKLSENIEPITIINKNCFLMERDTAIELGGYPKESINLIVPANADDEAASPYGDGIYYIGDLDAAMDGHCSFGKIVILWADDIPDDKLYDFTQAQLMTDVGIRMENVMLRQSPNHYQINMRVGKEAINSGFTIPRMGRTIYDAFAQMEHVRAVTVIMLVGDNPLYKKLYPLAEKIKELSLALNHILDGIEMDCASCEQSVVCDEINEVRALHRRSVRYVEDCDLLY